MASITSYLKSQLSLVARQWWWYVDDYTQWLGHVLCIKIERTAKVILQDMMEAKKDENLKHKLDKDYTGYSEKVHVEIYLGCGWQESSRECCVEVLKH